MQVVENTCIGHEISLRKISEPLASKALDLIPVTAQPQEMQCWRRYHLLEVELWQIWHVDWGISGTSHLSQGRSCATCHGTQLHIGATEIEPT